MTMKTHDTLPARRPVSIYGTLIGRSVIALAAGFTFTMTLLAADFAEIRNADDSVVDIRRDLPPDWAAPAHKFGPEHATRFVRVVRAPRPAADAHVFKLERVQNVSATELTFDHVPVRLATNTIVANIRADTERRITEFLPVSDRLALLERFSELQEKRQAGETLTTEERAELTAMRAKLAKVKAIRAHGKTLAEAAATVTDTTTGWPE